MLKKIILLLIFIQCSILLYATGVVTLPEDRITIEGAGTYTDPNTNTKFPLLSEDTRYNFKTDIVLSEFLTNNDMYHLILNQTGAMHAVAGSGDENSDSDIQLTWKISEIKNAKIMYRWEVENPDGSSSTFTWNVADLSGDEQRKYGVEIENNLRTNPQANDVSTVPVAHMIFHTPSQQPPIQGVAPKVEKYKVVLRVSFLSGQIVYSTGQIEDLIIAPNTYNLPTSQERQRDQFIPTSFEVTKELIVSDNTPIGYCDDSTNENLLNAMTTNIVWGKKITPSNPNSKTHNPRVGFKHFKYYEGTTGEHINDEVVVYVKDNNPLIDMESVGVYLYYQIGPFETWRLWDFGGNNHSLTWYTTLYPPYRIKHNTVSGGYVSEEKSTTNIDEQIQYSTQVGDITSPGTKRHPAQLMLPNDLVTSYDYINTAPSKLHDEDKPGYPKIQWRGKDPFHMYFNFSGHTASGFNQSQWNGDGLTKCLEYKVSLPTVLDNEFDWPGKYFWWVGPLKMKIDKNSIQHSADPTSAMTIDGINFSGAGSVAKYTLDPKYVVLPNRFATSSKFPDTSGTQWPNGQQCWPTDPSTWPTTPPTGYINNNGDTNWPPHLKTDPGGMLMFVSAVGPEQNGYYIKSYKTAKDFSTKIGSKFTGDEKGSAINCLKIKDNDRPIFYVAINHPIEKKWYRYMMMEYPSMRFYNTSPIYPIVCSRTDYRQTKKWSDILGSTALDKDDIKPRDLHNIGKDSNDPDNYFEKIWGAIVTKVEGNAAKNPPEPPAHKLLDYHMPFPNSVGYYTMGGGRVMYELNPPSGSGVNIYAEAAGKKFHNKFFPSDPTAFNAAYGSMGITFKQYRQKYALRTGVRHTFHIVSYDNLNNIYLIGKGNDVDLYNNKANSTTNKLAASGRSDGVYSRLLWRYSYLFEGEFDRFFSFDRPAEYTGTKKCYPKALKSLMQNYNILVNTSGTLTSISDREDADTTYARIYDPSQPAGYKGYHYKEFRPENFKYFQDGNRCDFVFSYVFKHKSDSNHRYLLEVFAKDSDKNARFLFMKIDVIGYSSSHYNTLEKGKTSNIK